MLWQSLHTSIFLLLLGAQLRSVAGFGQNAKLLAHVCVQYSDHEMQKAIKDDTIMWAVLSKEHKSCEPVEPGFTLVLNSYEQQPGISKCVDFPVYQQSEKSSTFFEGKYWAFCTQPKGKLYRLDQAVFVNAKVSPWLPSSGILHLELSVGGQIWLQVQPFEKMDIIPALSFCNPAQVEDGKVVNSRDLIVWGHRDGTTAASIPPGKEPEAGGQMLMAVRNNECVFRELEDYYVEPPGAPFLITVVNTDDKFSKPQTLPFTKDAHTLFHFEYAKDGLISSSWKIYEDQSHVLSQCAAVCPALKSAMTSYPEATIDVLIPEALPTEPDMMSTACSIRYCLIAEVACSALTMHWPALDIPIRNLECPCACKSAFTKPACLHVDVCAAGECEDHVKSVWACAKTKKDGACRGVVTQFSSSPKILECVERKDLSQISLTPDKDEDAKDKDADDSTSSKDKNVQDANSDTEAEEEDDKHADAKDKDVQDANSHAQAEDEDDKQVDAKDKDVEDADSDSQPKDVDADTEESSGSTDDTKLFSLGDMFKAARALPSSAPRINKSPVGHIVSMVACAVMLVCVLAWAGLSLHARAVRRNGPTSLEDFRDMVVE